MAEGIHELQLWSRQRAFWQLDAVFEATHQHQPTQTEHSRTEGRGRETGGGDEDLSVWDPTAPHTHVQTNSIISTT